MDQMERRLIRKYSTAFDMSSEKSAFEVYDLEKGSNKAWFQYGVYPAKARSYLYENEPWEFQVRIETDGKKMILESISSSWGPIMWPILRNWMSFAN